MRFVDVGRENVLVSDFDQRYCYALSFVFKQITSKESAFKIFLYT